MRYKYFSFIVMLSILVMITSCNSQKIQLTRGYTPFVSLVSLISVPDKFLNQEIVTIGVIELHSQGDYLYLSQQDADHLVIPNSLSLDFTSRNYSREDAKQYSGLYVVVRGILRLNKRGVGNVSSGTLYDITEVTPTPGRERKN